MLQVHQVAPQLCPRLKGYVFESRGTDVLRQGAAGNRYHEILQESDSCLPTESERHVGAPHVQPVGVSRVVTYETGW